MNDITTHFKAEVVPESPHARWVRSLGCGVPGCHRTPVHAHHATTRGAGGKADDLVNLCWYHHIGPMGGHTMGWKTWERRFGVNLADHAARLARISREAGRLP